MIELQMTEWEAKQLKAAIDYLISDCDEQALVAISNRLNGELNGINSVSRNN